MGKVNCYDVENLVQETVMLCQSILAGQLRFMLRDIEKNKDFAAISKEDIWTIRFGEYRDQSEIVVHMDRVAKSEKDWKRAVQKAEKQEEELVASYWYQLQLKDSTCAHKRMHFAEFEDCVFENLVLDGCDLTGARFRKCQFIYCSFQNAMLKQVDFSDCTFKETCFLGADFYQVIVSQKELEGMELSEEQLENLYVEMEADV